MGGWRLIKNNPLLLSKTKNRNSVEKGRVPTESSNGGASAEMTGGVVPATRQCGRLVREMSGRNAVGGGMRG